MKALIVLLICLIPTANLLAAHIDSVQMSSALTNEHGVLVVFLKGRSGSTYTLSCNKEEESCKFPYKNRAYSLDDSANKLYKCQNVELQYGVSETVGPYCLVSVE